MHCTFRVGKSRNFGSPTLGNKSALYWATNGVTTIPIRFDAVGSVFVIFRKAAPMDNAIAITRDGDPLFTATSAAQVVIEIQQATFGVPGDADQSRT